MGIDELREHHWILLPGTLCSAEVFDGLLDTLGVEKARRYPIVLKYPRTEDYLPDMQDIISSIANDAAGVCTGLGHDNRPQIIVCGFSLGAIVVAHLADRLDVSALVLFGLNPNADDPTKASGRLGLEDAVYKEGGRTALESRLPSILGPSPDRTRELILSMADDTASFIGAQTILALTRPGAMNALASSRCPIRLLTGSEDSGAPFKLAFSAANAAADGRAMPLEGLGHYALAEDPKLCCTLLKEVFST